MFTACGGALGGARTPEPGSNRFPIGNVKFAPNQLPAPPDSGRYALIVGTGEDTSTFISLVPYAAKPTSPTPPSAGENLALLALGAYLGLAPEMLGVSLPPGEHAPSKSGPLAISLLAAMTGVAVPRVPAGGALLADGTWLTPTEVMSFADAFATATGERLPQPVALAEERLAITADEQTALGESYGKVRGALLPLWPQLLSAQAELTTPRAVQKLATRALARAKAAEARHRAGENLMALERLSECAAAAAVAGWLSGWTTPPASAAAVAPLSPTRAFVMARRGSVPALAQAPTLTTVPPSIRDEVSEDDPSAVAASAAQRTGAWATTLEAILALPGIDTPAKAAASARVNQEISAHILTMRAIEELLEVKRDPLSGVTESVQRADTLDQLLTRTEENARRHAQRALLLTGSVPFLVRYEYQAGKSRMSDGATVEAKMDAIESFLYASLFARLAETAVR